MILILICALFFASPALAATYYVSPSGSGSTCSSGTPCSFSTGLSTAGNGDKVILKDGTYTTALITQRDGVTFEGENRRLAIVRLNSGGSFKHLHIQHSNTTVRRIRFDAINHINGGNGGAFGIDGRQRSVVIQNILFEDNTTENSPNPCFVIRSTKDVVVRFNTFDDCGYSGVGEGVYIGQTSSSDPAFNIEVYGNTIKNNGQQCFDAKDGTGPNINIHHNICESQAFKTGSNKNSTEGTISLKNNDNHFHDNIIRNNVNSTRSGGSSGNVIQLTGAGGPGGGDIAENNVIYNNSGHFALFGCDNTGAGPNSIIRNNTVCGSSPYTTESGCSGLTVTSNTTNAAQSVCDAEEARILAEIATLPGNPDQSPSQCNDSVDNDGDGDTDFPADSGCTDAEDNTEIGPLVAHWTFDNVGTDSSGNSISASLQLGATYTTGQVNQALTLDGVDDYATASTNAKLEVEPALTIMAWVRTAATGIRDIYSKWNTTTGGYRLLMGVDGDGNAADGLLALDINKSGVSGADRYVATTATINDGNWHHVAVTTLNGNTILYIDGQQSATGQQETIVLPSGDEATIGSRTDGTRFWDGEIDELKIYNEVVTASAILAEYNSGQGGDIGLSFTDLSAQAVSTTVTSNSVVITPANGTAISISESCSPACTAQYQIYQGDCSTVAHAWTAIAGTVDNGECVQLRLTTHSAQGWTGTATLTVGAFMDAWQVTTLSTPPDPDLFPARVKASDSVQFSGSVTFD